ncbi:10977_t:CDS:2, partial [Funneliformis caledonium]
MPNKKSNKCLLSDKESSDGDKRGSLKKPIPKKQYRSSEKLDSETNSEKFREEKSYQSKQKKKNSLIDLSSLKNMAEKAYSSKSVYIIDSASEQYDDR